MSGPQERQESRHREEFSSAIDDVHAILEAQKLILEELRAMHMLLTMAGSSRGQAVPIDGVQCPLCKRRTDTI